MLIVRSPVRVSFGGGGTDIPAYFERYGGAVLSTAINKYFYTVLCKRSDGKVQVISSDLRAVETWEDIARMTFKGSELEIPLAVLKELRANVSVDLFLASEIPPGTGLGSSASVCVNVLKTLSTYLDVPMSKHALAEKAFHIARNVLEKPVGKQDEYASAFGGLNFIRFAQDGSVAVEPVDVDSEVLHELENSLMLFFTGSAHQSWTILKEQETNTATPSSLAVDALHEILELAHRMKEALSAGDLQVFGELLDQGWRAKKRVSKRISTDRIDDLYALARSKGAIGGKITGAGGGGFLMLYCEPARQDEVRAAFSAIGVREMGFRFDTKGTHVVVNDPFIDGDPRCGTEWVFLPAESESHLVKAVMGKAAKPSRAS